jgi:hypothetical protein
MILRKREREKERKREREKERKREREKERKRERETCLHVRALPTKVTFHMLHSRVGHWPHPQTLD